MNDKELEEFKRGTPAPAEDRTTHKQILGITFIDHQGKPFGLQYAHLLFCEVVESALVVTFTTHKVTLAGRGLFAPAKNCLMRLIQNHKIEFVTCVAGGPARDFGQADGIVVTGVRVEKVEEK
jgi:hypothetical protein